MERRQESWFRRHYLRFRRTFTPDGTNTLFYGEFVMDRGDSWKRPHSDIEVGERGFEWKRY